MRSNSLNDYKIFSAKIVGIWFLKACRDCVAATATRYGLDGSGFKPRSLEEILSFHPLKPAQGNTQPPVKWVPASVPGSKAARTCR